MKGRDIVLFAVLTALVIAAGFLSNVKADDDDDHVLSFVNKTTKDIYVEVKTSHDPNPGDRVEKSYFVPAEGSDDVLLDEGTYWVFYWACGQDQPGVDQPFDIKVNLDNDYQIIVYPCDANPTKLNVRNHLAETVTLELIGYEEYSYEVAPGLTAVEVFSGENIYKYDACDGDFSGVVDIKKNGTSSLTLPSCEWFDDPAVVYGAGNIAKFNIINHASFPVILSIIGPMNDLVEIGPGENSLILVAGSYEFSYYLNYELVTGSFFVPPNGNGVLFLSPEYTIDYGLVEQEDLE